MKKFGLKIYNNELLPFYPVAIYFGVKLDRSLLSHHQLALRKKLSSLVLLLRQLAGSGRCWCQNTTYSCFIFVFYSTAKYGNPVCCRSGHTCFINSVLNNALRLVTGCLSLSPMDYLPVFFKHSSIRALSTRSDALFG